MGDKIYVPYQEAESEFVEKRSRFIGHIWPVDSEDQAQELIRRVKKQHYDARHNCWCYLLGGSVVRYSDDGEPQGTAGQPMLAVFQREHVTNVLCVVTRYFGGILLGAGGLTRAYSKSARDALAAAGVAAMDTISITLTLRESKCEPCSCLLARSLELPEHPTVTKNSADNIKHKNPFILFPPPQVSR